MITKSMVGHIVCDYSAMASGLVQINHQALTNFLQQAILTDANFDTLPTWQWYLPESLILGEYDPEFSSHEDAVLHYMMVLCSTNACFWQGGNGTPLTRWSYKDATGATALANFLKDQYNAGTFPGLHLSDDLEISKHYRPYFEGLHHSDLRYLYLEEASDPQTFRSWLTQSKVKNIPRYSTQNAIFMGERYPIFGEDPWLKRAQLALGMAAGFMKAPKEQVQLTAYADYRIPQVLRALGILTYEPRLAEQVDNQKILSNGIAEEAIRAATIMVTEHMASSLRTTGAHIDAHLFLLSRQMEKEGRLKQPHHLCITLNY